MDNYKIQLDLINVHNFLAELHGALSGLDSILEKMGEETMTREVEGAQYIFDKMRLLYNEFHDEVRAAELNKQTRVLLEKKH